MAWLDDITGLLGRLGLLDTGQTYSDPLNISPRPIANANFGAAGGAAPRTPLDFGADPSGGAAAAGWAAWLPTLQQILGVGAAGYGAYNVQDQMRVAQRLYEQFQANAAQQRAAAAAMMNPGIMAQRALAATQPLNKQLVYQVSSAVDANAALRGLGQAPGALASAEATALAPFEQENLRMGVNLAQGGAGAAFNLPTATTAPNYLALLNQLKAYNSPYTLPTGAGF